MSRAQVIIRDGRREDVSDVLRLWAASGASRTPTDTPEDVERAVSEPALEFLVAETNGQVVGTIMGGFDGWRGAISRLTVAESHRRQGIGRALLDEVKVRFVRNGVKVVGALVEKDHPWAMAYWASVGFPRRAVRVLQAPDVGLPPPPPTLTPGPSPAIGRGERTGHPQGVPLHRAAPAEAREIPRLRSATLGMTPLFPYPTAWPVGHLDSSLRWNDEACC